MRRTIGSACFIIGVVLAIILGVVGAAVGLGVLGTVITSILVLLGLIVGFLNITGKEQKDFVMMALALAIVAYFGAAATLGTVEVVGTYLAGMFNALMLFVVPAVVVVTLRAIWALAKVK